MDSHKEVYVLLATFNGAKYLEAQIDSILNQGLPNGFLLKVLVSDDGSTDQTLGIINSFVSKFDNIELLPCERPGAMGPAKNFYKLLNVAAKRKATYIAFADQDDLWCDGKLNRAISVLAEQDLDLYLGSATLVDSDLNLLGRIPSNGLQTSLPSLLLANQRAGMTFVLGKNCIDLAATHHSENIVMHDWWIELLAYSANLGIFEDDLPFVLYRQHGENAMGIAINLIQRYKLGFKRGAELFVRRSDQAESLLSTGLLEEKSDAQKVAALTHPLPASLGSLFSILKDPRFFRNRKGIRSFEARILFIISYIFYNVRKFTK